jgi:putative endopeptidase
MKVCGQIMRITLNCAGIIALSFGTAAVHAQNAQTAASADTHGIAVANIDRSVKPGDDFYMYANGEWIKRTEIPPDRAGIGVFSALDSESNKRTAALIDEAVKSNAPAGTNARKIADLYNS